MVGEIDRDADLRLVQQADVDGHLQVGPRLARRAVCSLETLSAVTVVTMLGFGDVGGDAPRAAIDLIREIARALGDARKE